MRFTLRFDGALAPTKTPGFAFVGSGDRATATDAGGNCRCDRATGLPAALIKARQISRFRDSSTVIEPRTFSTKRARLTRAPKTTGVGAGGRYQNKTFSWS